MLQSLSDNVTGRLTRYACVVALGWTALATSMYIWMFASHRHETLDNAAIQARAAFEKDVLYRRWSALRGGVYVRAGELTPPNPFLTGANRDITASDGTRLTLVNPAYMTRQVHELQKTDSSVLGHITSLRPLNPGNAPDAWEQKALRSFEQGSPEQGSVEDLAGSTYFRLMRPLFVEQSCLKCHAVQGYKVGEVRGGISVAVPMAPILAVSSRHQRHTVLRYGGLWAVGVIGLLFAYLGLRRQLVQLAGAREAADSANRAKSEFLTNMSHEIRTPMTAILGFADLLQNGEQTPSDRLNSIETIRRNGQHLLSIINDTLDLSKIEAGRMLVEHIPCSPCQIVADVAALMRPRATAQGLSLEVDYAFPLPGAILSDPVRLQQILTNLVGNAVKFTAKGGVRILVGADNSTPATSRLKFEVVDTGLGINPEQISKLFQSFTQADSSTTRKYGGTGLGLAISRRLAQLLGGDIIVESSPDAGSRFVLTIRADTPPNATIIESAAQIRSSSQPQIHDQGNLRLSGRILLAEDGLDNQRLISFHLRRAGAEVVIVDNGKLAVEHAMQAQAEGTPFRIILMDMQMPVMDGYNATRTLRRSGFTRPIIALTANAMTSDRDACVQAGCDEYITKPIDSAAMLRVCEKFMDAAASESSYATACTARA